jgi:hypothetical protein
MYIRLKVLKNNPRDLYKVLQGMKYVLCEQRYCGLSKNYSRVRYLIMGVTGDTADPTALVLTVGLPATLCQTVSWSDTTSSRKAIFKYISKLFY